MQDEKERELQNIQDGKGIKRDNNGGGDHKKQGLK